MTPLVFELSLALLVSSILMCPITKSLQVFECPFETMDCSMQIQKHNTIQLTTLISTTHHTIRYANVSVYIQLQILYPVITAIRVEIMIGRMTELVRIIKRSRICFNSFNCWRRISICSSIFKPKPQM